MQWFTTVAMVVGVAIGLQGAVVSFGETVDETRSGSRPPSEEHRVSSPALQPEAVAQQENGTQDSYRYDAKGRRDPFESLVQEASGEKIVGSIKDPERPLEPLERFDLSALKLMGIVWGELGRRAIIRAPDGKGYFVAEGMYMGQNGGQIITINDDELILKEKYKTIKGNITDKTLAIPLRRKDKQEG